MPAQWRPRAAESLLPKRPSELLLRGLLKLGQLSKVEQYLLEQRSQAQVAANKTKAPSSPGSWLVQPKALGLGALSAAVIGAGFWWLLKRAKEKASAAIVELRRNTLVNNPEDADRPAQPDATAPVDVDLVECSVYAPRAARPGAQIMIQVFLHLPEQREQARFLAEAMDSSATSRGIQTLEIDVKRGARVEISLAAGTLSVDEPVQSVIWRGRTVFSQFFVDIPEGTSGQNFFLAVRVRVDGSLIGSIKFRISSDQKATNLEPVILGDYARRYKKAFVSHATIDREEVLKRVQIMRTPGAEVFSGRAYARTWRPLGEGAPRIHRSLRLVPAVLVAGRKRFRSTCRRRSNTRTIASRRVRLASRILYPSLCNRAWSRHRSLPISTSMIRSVS